MPQVACAEYCGTFSGAAPYRLTKKCYYIRTWPDIAAEFNQAVKTTEPRQVYEDLRTASSDMTNIPHDSKHVRNACYLDRKKEQQSDA